MITREEMLTAMEILQPVTPTDGQHQAHWWNEGFGIKVMSAQIEWIKEVKSRLVLCEDKECAREVLQKTAIKWPAPSKVAEESLEFWTNGFGATIVACFRVNFVTFQQRIVSIDTQMR